MSVHKNHFRGDLLKRWREHNCWTQDDVAARLHVSPSSVSRYEHGGRPGAYARKQIAKLTKISVEEFLTPPEGRLTM